jgi:hypothetical protein
MLPAGAGLISGGANESRQFGLGDKDCLAPFVVRQSLLEVGSERVTANVYNVFGFAEPKQVEPLI